MSSDVHGMWFIFSKDVHRFSVHEFGSITGLKCDEGSLKYACPSARNRLRVVYFSGNERVSRDALIKFLTNKPVYHCDEYEAKLVQLFFVECALYI